MQVSRIYFDCCSLYFSIQRYNQDCITSGIMPLGPSGNTVYGYATYVLLISPFKKYLITNTETNIHFFS